MKPQIVNVKDRLYALSNFCIDAGIVIISNLEDQFQLRKQRIQRFPRTDHIRLAKVSHVRRAIARAISKDIAEATSRLQGRSPESDLDVVN